MTASSRWTLQEQRETSIGVPLHSQSLIRSLIRRIEDGDVIVVLICSKICRAVEEVRKANKSSSPDRQAGATMTTNAATNTVYSLLSRLRSYPPTPTLPSREPLASIDNLSTPPASPKPPMSSPAKHPLVRIIPEVKNWRTEELVLSGATIYGVPHSVQLEYLHAIRGPPSEIGRPAPGSHLGKSYRQVTKLTLTLLGSSGQINEARGFDFGALQPFPALRELELQHPLAVVEGTPIALGCRCLEKIVLDMQRVPDAWTSHSVGLLLHHLAPKVLRCVRPPSNDMSDLASTLLSRPKSVRDISISYIHGSSPSRWSLEVVYKQDGRVRVLEAVDAVFLKRAMNLKAVWATASSVTLPDRVPECVIQGLLRQEMRSLREFVVVVGDDDNDRSLRLLAEHGARLDTPPWQTKSCTLRVQDTTGRLKVSLEVLNGLCSLFQFPPETDFGRMRMKGCGQSTGFGINSLHSRISNHRHAYST